MSRLRGHSANARADTTVEFALEDEGSAGDTRKLLCGINVRIMISEDYVRYPNH